MNSTTDNNNTTERNIKECLHCGEQVTYELDCGGTDPCCVVCWTNYARPREDGESWDDYSTRLPFVVEGEEREITKEEIKQRFDTLFVEALLSTPVDDENEEEEGECETCGKPAKNVASFHSYSCMLCDEHYATEIHDGNGGMKELLDEEEEEEVEGECVYCRATATYECDRCEKSEGSDGGKMCEGCYYKNGVVLGEETLCGGCYWEHQNQPCRLEKS